MPVSQATVVSYPPAMEVLSAVYCNDEDIAIRAGGDFGVLCPEWQQLASGTDGSFASTDLWTLNSATADFVQGGVYQQCVILLSGPKPNFKGAGQLLAVDVVQSSGAVTLRRLGGASHAGQPPSPIGGLSGVTFAINSLGPQIEAETFILNQRFSIDPTIPGRSPPDIYDLRVLRYACMLGVLWKRYATETRAKNADFEGKAIAVKQELSEVYDQLTIRWAAATIGQDLTNWFTTRIGR